MSHAFDARFSPGALGLQEMLRRLEPSLDQSGIAFAHQIVRLQPGGVPLAAEHVTTLAEAARQAKSWWGVSLYCVSRTLASVLGRSDSIEVYLRVLPAGDKQRMLVYSENSGAFGARCANDALAVELAAFLLRTCDALRCDLAVYAEEDGRTPIPDRAEIERRLSRQAQTARPLAWMAVARGSVIGFSQTCLLAGRWRDRVHRSGRDNVVLPFVCR